MNICWPRVNYLTWECCLCPLMTKFLLMFCSRFIFLFILYIVMCEQHCSQCIKRIFFPPYMVRYVDCSFSFLCSLRNLTLVKNQPHRRSYGGRLKCTFTLGKGWTSDERLWILAEPDFSVNSVHDCRGPERNPPAVRDQREGTLTATGRAAQSVGRESGDFGCLSEGSGCCESIAVMSRPLALRAGRGLPTGMPSYKSVAH